LLFSISATSFSLDFERAEEYICLNEKDEKGDFFLFATSLFACYSDFDFDIGYRCVKDPFNSQGTRG
jgi:hypothetical protein